MTDLKSALAAFKANTALPTGTPPAPTPAASRPAPSPKKKHAPTTPAQPTDKDVEADTAAQAAATPSTSPTQSAPSKLSRVLPTLEALARLYPKLFGAEFLPLKRGIDQDLLTAHATEFEPQALKEALSFHTRSTRYINVVATGLARHDLQGNSAEPMAPEHIHHALMESYRRRLNRNPASKDTGTGRNMTRQDTPVQQRAKLIGRLANAIDASGMPRSEYAEKMRGKDETANTILNEAVAQSAERAAKDVALANAFNASGQSLEAFAQMYGMDARVVSASMERVARSAAPVTP